MATPIHPAVSDPNAAVNAELEAGANPFACYSSEQWKALLIRSIDEPVINGVAFPRYPEGALQQRMHGGDSSRHSIEGAFRFFDAVGAHVGRPFDPEECLLDFGSGWGRIVRPYMPHFNLRNIIGLEPNPWFCQIARALNPYVTFFNSNYAAPSVLRAGAVDYCVSWSVFSHLSEGRCRAWLAEFARLARPGAMIFVTTWGKRFLDELQEEADNIARGEPKNWYRGAVLKRVKDLGLLRSQFNDGKVVWIPGANEYGETFIPDAAARAMAPEQLRLVSIDDETLAQSLLVYRRV